jgi:hypothetical protein
MKLKRILIVMAVAGSSVALQAMDGGGRDAFAAERERLEEKGRKLAQQQAVIAAMTTLRAENAQQKDTITKLEKDVSALSAKLFFWRTPAILAGVAAAAYGSWFAYEWWTGKDNSSTVNEPVSSEVASNEASTNDASSTSADSDAQDQNSPASPDESSQDAAAASQTNSDVAPTISHDVLIVPNSTPPGSQAQS